MSRRIYTSDEDKVIKEKYGDLSVEEIADILKRDVQSIRKRASKLGVTKPLKRWSTKEDNIIQNHHKNGGQLKDLVNILDRGLSEVSSRAKKLGYSPWRTGSGKHSGRPIDGFKDGKPVYTHRRVAEHSLGRKLKSSEIVHHIDFDKENNTMDNFVILSRSEHRKAHMTFEAIVPELLRREIIGFNRETHSYFLKEEDDDS